MTSNETRPGITISVTPDKYILMDITYQQELYRLRLTKYQAEDLAGGLSEKKEVSQVIQCCEQQPPPRHYVTGSLYLSHRPDRGDDWHLAINSSIYNFLLTGTRAQALTCSESLKHQANFCLQRL